MIIPLFHKTGPSHGRTRIFFYFSGIGIGYIFVEMAMIQRFGLYFGNTLHAVATVISAMLMASGMGSYASARLTSSRIKSSVVLAGIILLLLVDSVFLTPLLLKTIGFSPLNKFLFSLLIIFPAAMLIRIDVAVPALQVACGQDVKKDIDAVF